MTSQSDVTEDECRTFYDTCPQNFIQPARFRASHLFLAALRETPPEVVESKEKVIDVLADRIRHGEKLGELAAAGSEDEATKTPPAIWVFSLNLECRQIFFPRSSKCASEKSSSRFAPASVFTLFN
jgi:hypothetical protein